MDLKTVGSPKKYLCWRPRNSDSMSEICNRNCAATFPEVSIIQVPNGYRVDYPALGLGGLLFDADGKPRNPGSPFWME